MMLSIAPAATADTAVAGPTPVPDVEFAQAILMAEHRLSMPILIRTDRQGASLP